MLNETIQKKISELPINVKKAIEKFDWATEIMHIAKNNQMQIDDMSILKKETLLVMIGLISAGDFEKNLVKQLGISHSFAERLVSDANEYIFYPLQKLAFGHREDEINEREQENISREKVTELMGVNGIELIEEKEEREYPKNELQDLADSLFGENKKIKSSFKTNETLLKHEKNIEEQVENKKEPTHVQKDDFISGREVIREEDLVGIKSHRIDTSIIKEKEDLQRIKTINNNTLEEKHKLDIDNLNKILISKEENIDVSPSKEEQISERGEFLKHIGAN